MQYQNIIVAVEDGIGFLAVNRPKALNALNAETLNDMIAGLKELGADASVGAIVLTGAGDKAFIAGADIAAMREMSTDDAVRFAELGHSAMAAIEDSAKPVIAMVNGYALGGGTEAALACDFVYASESAKFGLPEVSLGIFPGFGGTQRLARVSGEKRAKELIFTGMIISAVEAREWGIVNKVAPAEGLRAEVIATAQEIMKKGPVAVRLAKRAVNRGNYRPLGDGLRIEREIFAECFATEDRKEGMAAFLEKRPPRFAGR